MMRKFFRSYSFLFLIVVFSNTNAFAKSSINGCASESLVTAPPTPNPQYLYYCLNETVAPLSAIPSGGGTLRWYATDTSSGFSTTAPTPSTATAATGASRLTYYVTQVISGVESAPRTPIYVYVNQQLDLYCQTITPNSIKFDFANVGQTSFSYSYTINGGTPITGTHSSPTNFTVSGLGERQTVEFTLTPVGAKSCVTTDRETCTTTCLPANIITPTFNPVPIYCLNDVVVLPTTSTNTPSITGSWSPSPIDTSTPGTTIYTFDPDPILFPCAKTTTLNILVKPIKPDFTDFPICSGVIPSPNLNLVSPNGITGIWNPSTVDNMNSDSYTFTPDLGQPCTPTNKTIYVTVNPSNVISSLNWTVTEAFSKNQIVTVTDPVGVNYLYQMDSGPFQTSPVFENAASGSHSISVKDANGCSELTDNNVLIIGYPKFFTPNGDTYNDTWNIPGLKDQLNSRIYIFDRYGKLLKDISPKDSGWDGTYIGQPMPADDYWFNVEYLENAVLKKFKSHFSLKR